MQQNIAIDNYEKYKLGYYVKLLIMLVYRLIYNFYDISFNLLDFLTFF